MSQACRLIQISSRIGPSTKTPNTTRYGARNRYAVPVSRARRRGGAAAEPESTSVPPVRVPVMTSPELLPVVLQQLVGVGRRLAQRVGGRLLQQGGLVHRGLDRLRDDVA